LQSDQAALCSVGVMVPPPARATFPHLADFSGAIGSGYVIEGSTLGGLLVANIA